MELTTLLKGASRLIAMRKSQELNIEELYSIGIYIPVFYFSMFAPGIFFLTGLSLFSATGISFFYSSVDFPRDFILTLGGGAWLLSALSYAFFNYYLKQVLDTEELDNPTEVLSLKENLVYSVKPFVKQFMIEHEKMLS
jgi:hypothetical protein